MPPWCPSGLPCFFLIFHVSVGTEWGLQTLSITVTVRHRRPMSRCKSSGPSSLGTDQGLVGFRRFPGTTVGRHPSPVLRRVRTCGVPGFGVPSVSPRLSSSEVAPDHLLYIGKKAEDPVFYPRPGVFESVSLRRPHSHTVTLPHLSRDLQVTYGLGVWTHSPTGGGLERT